MNVPPPAPGFSHPKPLPHEGAFDAVFGNPFIACPKPAAGDLLPTFNLQPSTFNPISWLGRVDYDVAWALQKSLVARRIAGEIGDTAILVEHPATITLGRGAHAENILANPAALEARGVVVREIDRGGDVTYHGPGQLVGYPMVDLTARGRDVHRYLRDLEGVLIAVLAEIGIAGERSVGATGVWVGNSKIAAIGVKVSRWVTSHGFALNVGSDLSGFDLIVPCGIRDRGVTSISRELGREVAIGDVIPIISRHLSRTLGISAPGEGAGGAEAPGYDRLDPRSPQPLTFNVQPSTLRRADELLHHPL